MCVSVVLRESVVIILFYSGNAGFETAENIVGSTNYIHMASRYNIDIPALNFSLDR